MTIIEFIVRELIEDFSSFLICSSISKHFFSIYFCSSYVQSYFNSATVSSNSSTNSGQTSATTAAISDKKCKILFF